MSNSRKRHLDVESSSERRKQKVTQPQRLHYGLYNQGNTCYLNSVLQVLFATKDFHNRLDPKSELTDKELRKFFEKLKAATCGTENIAKTFEIKNVNQQSDAPECLEFILQKVSPGASEVFQGELTHSTECSEGHIINDETNPFWTLPMPLNDTHDSTFSVEKGFEKIFKTTTFSGDNMVYCNECQRKREAKSGCEMTGFPPNLILLLKRFDIDYSTMSHFKSDCCVEVPHVLQRKDKKYRLYGMVNHMGSLGGGHYTATILSEDNTWYEFNDDYVQKVKEPFAHTRTHNSRTAHLLLYRASGSEREEERERYDQTGQMDQQMGHKVEHKRLRENAASSSQRDKGREQNVETGHLDQQKGRIRGSAGENRQAQESRAQMGKESGKGSFGHHYRGEEGHPEHGRKDPSVIRNQRRIPAEEVVFLPENPTPAYSSKHPPDSRTRPDKRTQMSRDREDGNSTPPCKRLADILQNRFVIGAIIVVGLLAIAVILIPVLVSNRPTITDREGNP